MVKKKSSKKSTKKGGSGAGKSTKGQGYDPTPFYKNMPEGYVAVKKVKKVTEIRGRPIGVSFDPNTRTGDVTIEDISGNVHSALITRSRTFDTLVHYMGERGTGFEAKYKGAENDSERKKMLIRALEFISPSPLLFRIAKVEGGENKGKPYLFSVMSSKWTSELTAENSIDTVKSIIKEAGLKANIKMEESNGLHGGHIWIEVKGNEGVIAASAHIDFGLFDNYHCVRGYAGGQILACDNQMTISIKGAMKNLDVGVFASLTEKHMGSTESFNDLVSNTMKALGEYDTIVNAGKKVTVSKEKVEMIVQYYVDKGVISKKTQEQVVEALKSEKIQQVKGTMFGLAMAFSYVGTHVDGLKDGVRGALKSLGGEILVVSQDPKGFWKLIKAHHDKRQSKDKQEPKAEKKAEEKTPKTKAEKSKKPKKAKQVKKPPKGKK